VIREAVRDTAGGGASCFRATRPQRLLGMDLTGHHSNPSTLLQALFDGVLGAPNERDRDKRRPERRDVKLAETGAANG